jgi:tetratricopeptide (TPR) repeat protein
MSELERIPSHTEEIDSAWVDALTQFVEAYRIKIDILELFEVKIPSGFFYNFAVYYAFVRKDFTTANYFIEKSLKAENQKVENVIDILRWAARINRLNRNETEAANFLTRIINLISASDFPYKNKYDDLYKARIYRSRGFCYFNKLDYDGAIKDFNHSLNLSDRPDTKLPYCYGGLAIATYKANKENLNDRTITEIIGYYEEAFKRERYFFAEDLQEFQENIKHLEANKQYYFSEFEKDALEDVYELYKSRKSS